MANRIEVPRKTKRRTAPRSSNPSSGYTPRENERVPSRDTRFTVLPGSLPQTFLACYHFLLRSMLVYTPYMHFMFTKTCKRLPVSLSFSVEKEHGHLQQTDLALCPTLILPEWDLRHFQLRTKFHIYLLKQAY